MRSDARLRRGQAKQQQLYSRRDTNWIEWPDAQKARMAAEAAYKALPAAAAPARKLQALKEWLIICLREPADLNSRLLCHPRCLLTLSDRFSPLQTQFSPRTGLAWCTRLSRPNDSSRLRAHSLGSDFCRRKLRLGVTLKKEGGSYTLDMTQARYKTSRFYGPSITSMSALLTEPLDAYLAAFQWETHGNETPYLFHPTDDTTRCLPSSQWSGVVKACFKKHSLGKVAPPPKVRLWVCRHACYPHHPMLTLLRPATGSSCGPASLRGCATARTPPTCSRLLQRPCGASQATPSAPSVSSDLPISILRRHKEATQQSDRYDKASHE